jgi:ribosomal protein L16/L10AE
LSGFTEAAAKEALKSAQYKLPMKTRFVKKV